MTGERERNAGTCSQKSLVRCVYVHVCACVCFGISRPSFNPCPRACFRQCSSVTPFSLKLSEITANTTHTLHTHEHTRFSRYDLTLKFQCFKSSNVRIISKAKFPFLSVKCAATDSLDQESLAYAVTNLSLQYSVNRNVCRRVRL